jgi:fatty acid/phospholipid biosynthesis enzyme
MISGKVVDRDGVKIGLLRLGKEKRKGRHAMRGEWMKEGRKMCVFFGSVKSL